MAVICLRCRHVLPRNLLEKYSSEEEPDYEQSLSHGETIIIYMHGNSGARANEQRIKTYHKLQDINCHVIAIDYRSKYNRYQRYGVDLGRESA